MRVIGASPGIGNVILRQAALQGLDDEEAERANVQSGCILYGGFSEVTTLEFLQHHFSEMGHRDLLVTHKYRFSQPYAPPMGLGDFA